MKILTDLDTLEWLQKREIRTDELGHLSFGQGKKATLLSLSPPTTREAITAIAVNLIEVLSSGENPLVGWLLWLKDFDIWSNEVEEVGWTLIEAVTKMQPQLNVNSRAFLFESHESATLKAALLVPILFSWDAYLIRGDGAVLVRIDHDDHSSILTISDAVLQEMKESQLSPWTKVILDL
jgi:hypothetical protein